MRGTLEGPSRIASRRRHLAITTLLCLGITFAIVSVISSGAVAAAGPPPNHWDAQNTSQSHHPLIVVHDIVVSGDTPLAPGQAPCAVTSQFYHGQKAVFRVKVINPNTGKPMNRSQLNGVTIHIASGSGKTLHAKDMGKFWVAPWKIPSSYPAGRVNYSISVTGRNSQTVNFAVQASQMTVRNQSISDINSTPSHSSNQPTTSTTSNSLPVTWLVIAAAAIVVVAGLVWNATRR